MTREEAEIEFARRTLFLKGDLHDLWIEERRRRTDSYPYGVRNRYLEYEMFLDMFLTSFRLAFVLRDDCIDYPYRELTKEDIDTFWKNNRDLFTRYDGDSFRKDEVEDIIAKRIREEEYERNVEEILLQLT